MNQRRLTFYTVVLRKERGLFNRKVVAEVWEQFGKRELHSTHTTEESALKRARELDKLKSKFFERENYIDLIRASATDQELKGLARKVRKRVFGWR